MTRGIVVKLFPDLGYGFVRDEVGNSHFLHASDLTGTFDMLREGGEVEFESHKTPKGYRARKCRVVLGEATA